VTPTFIPPAAASQLDWIELTEAIAAGHDLPRAEVADTFLYRDPDTLLNRAAWIDGLGIVVKSATIFPRNTGPTIGGAVSLLSDRDGALEAILDFHLVTYWKTAGDSLLAARRLAPPGASRILIVGAGTVANSLRAAYGAAFPKARFEIWNRTADKARALADQHPDTVAVTDLPEAVGRADIVTSATMSTDPVISGAWLRPGQHIDLIGAYRPDMREVDDLALTRARIFVDSRDTTMGHIGELKIPLEAGTIGPDDIVADYYDLDRFTRSPEDITLFKNGGGAHLDLMTCKYIQSVWKP
jgi:ornithine cyclodeaminase